MEDDLDIILNSPLFDAEWYVAAYPDVPDLGLLPEYHFLTYGALLGRAASAGFSAATHPAIYRIAAAAGRNPLLVYLDAQGAGGRDPAGGGGAGPG